MQSARSTLSATQADADDALERVAELTGQGSYLETEIARLEERRKDLEVTTKTAQAAADGAQEILQSLRVEQGKLPALIEAQEAKLEDVNNSLSEGRKQLAALQEQMEATPQVVPAVDAPADEPEDVGNNLPSTKRKDPINAD